MVAAPGMLLKVGKKLKEAVPPVPYLCDSHAIPINLASSKKLLSSFLYYFSLSYLDRPSLGAEVGRFERFVFLFLALFCQAFCFCFF